MSNKLTSEERATIVANLDRVSREAADKHKLFRTISDELDIESKEVHQDICNVFGDALEQLIEKYRNKISYSVFNRSVLSGISLFLSSTIETTSKPLAIDKDELLQSVIDRLKYFQD